MADILHRIEIKAAPDKVYEAVAPQQGLASWWTPQADAPDEVGSVAKFRFGDGTHGPDFEVTDLSPDQRVAWRWVGGVEDWVDTDVTFDIRPTPDGSVVLFGHKGWKQAGEFYMHCNSKWGFFLGTSLKDYVETGKGRPAPEDPDL